MPLFSGTVFFFLKYPGSNHTVIVLCRVVRVGWGGGIGIMLHCWPWEQGTVCLRSLLIICNLKKPGISDHCFSFGSEKAPSVP